MRELIVSEIQRIAAESGGRPPGVRLFASRTGIAEHKWRGSIWARWGDALAEAGFQPNTLQSRLESEAVLIVVAELARRLGAVPTVAEMKLERRTDPSFPNPKTVAAHFGIGRALVPPLRALAERDPAHIELLAFLPQTDEGGPAERPKEKPAGAAGDGWVYLIRSGDFYKVGRSDELERRVKEIRLALPEAATLLHAIQTDDPPGIEAYWHRRFADRRANGEWFRLTASDVAAFTRRRFQ